MYRVIVSEQIYLYSRKLTFKSSFDQVISTLDYSIEVTKDWTVSFAMALKCLVLYAY